MRLGEVLVGRGYVSVADVAAALARQRVEGGRLGDNIVGLGLMTAAAFAEAIAAIDATTPAAPRTLAETALPPGLALNLMLKLLLRDALETEADIAQAIRLPVQVVRELLDEAVQRKLVQSLGTVVRGLIAVLRFALTEDGRAAALAALDQNRYLGPAPVPLAAFQAQITRQPIGSDRNSAADLRAGLTGLAIPERVVEKLLPAINAGRTTLLFGPPGNGKTTIASRIAGIFRQVVYIPHAVEIAGQIMRVFDPGLHRPVISAAESEALTEKTGLQLEAYDDRWVACRRPFAIAGGELTMEMLDLQYDPDARFYEAPLHIKALNGVLLIDDFGRQRVSPTELLNRWIGPMELRVEYLKLHTGKSFSLPFDQLLMFSTNIDPRDIMDPAFLRRIPYKIKLFPPAPEEYRAIFAAEAAAQGVTLAPDVCEDIMAILNAGKFGLAYFQPKFVCAQIAERARATGIPPVLTRQRAVEALANLYVEIEDAATTPPT